MRTGSRGPRRVGQGPATRGATGAAKTIAALATAAGPAGVSVVRISGPEAHAVARRVCPGLAPDLPLRRMALARVVDPAAGSVVDEALVVLFAEGASFTGEAVAEIHGHGGVAQARALLDAVLAAGAEPAGPGAFTRRAVEHGCLDLARAEGLAEVVAAGHEAALGAAWSLFDGALSRRVSGLVDEAAEILADVEALLDFPDAAPGVEAEPLPGRIEAVAEAARALEGSHARGSRLRNGARVVLLGPPNAGKSTLLNALAGTDRALVDAAPGTTRDLVEAPVDLAGTRLVVVDGAGVREDAPRVEAAGIARIEAAAAGADLVVVAADTSVAPGPALARVAGLVADQDRVVVAGTKDDLGGAYAGAVREALGGRPLVPVSAVAGTGLEALGAALVEAVAARPVGEGEIVVILARHRAALAEAAGALGTAAGLVGAGEGLDAAAEELRAARRALASIVDRQAVPEEVLDRIFARFCIGK